MYSVSKPTLGKHINKVHGNKVFNLRVPLTICEVLGLAHNKPLYH